MRSASSSKKKPDKIRDHTFFLDFVRVTGAIPALLWKRPRIHYIGNKAKSQPKGGVLIASNHITFTDPILLYLVFWYRRVRFLATKDLYKNGLVTFLFNLAGCIQVDKDNFNMRSLHHVIDRLKAGKAITIFPEGQVNSSQQTLSFKSGAVLMAHLAGVPILPVYLARRKKWYHRCVVIVGEPIDVGSLCSRFPTMEEMQRAADHIHQQETALEQYYIQNIEKSRGDTL